MICIPKNMAMALKTRLKSGEITPGKLAEMTSAERNAYFSTFLSEKEAKAVNALYESKTLLKNQQTGLLTWLKTVTGVTPETRRGLIERVSKLDKVLDPAEERAFLADLAEQKLGVGVSLDEARTISNLSKDYQEARAKVNVNTPKGSDLRYDVGAAQVKFDNYVAELKRDANATTLRDFATNPMRTAAGKFSDIGGLAKSMKATLDNSFLFRQGFKAMIAHPKEWAKNAAGSFKIIADQLGDKATSDDVVNAIKAEIYGRENYLNGSYKKMGLDIGTVEEAFPTSLPEKVPVLGRIFKASEAAFNGTAYRLRADVADAMMRDALKSGRDVTEKELLKSIGTYTNSLTGRGDLGRAEGFAKAFNNLFFSPRNFKSNLDFLSAHLLDPNVDPYVKKKALANLSKMIIAVGGGLAIAKAVNPDSVDFDPRSTDFGKIKIGNTRVDVTAGMASIITLAAREATQSSKSSTSGRISKIDSGKFGSKTTLSVLGDFLTNKLAPVPGTITRLRAGKDFNGNPENLTSLEGVGTTLSDLFAPLPITNAVELQSDPESAGLILGTMLDGLGFGTNTYH